MRWNILSFQNNWSSLKKIWCMHVSYTHKWNHTVWAHFSSCGYPFRQDLFELITLKERSYDRFDMWKKNLWSWYFLTQNMKKIETEFEKISIVEMVTFYFSVYSSKNLMCSHFSLRIQKVSKCEVEMDVFSTDRERGEISKGGVT